MAKLRTADFYYGALISALLNNGVNPTLIENLRDRREYDLTTDQLSGVLLMVKYRSAPINTKAGNYRSWQFVFSENDKESIRKYLEERENFSIGFICGDTPLNNSEYAVLHKQDVIGLDMLSKGTLTISRKMGERSYRVFKDGTRGTALKIKMDQLY